MIMRQKSYLFNKLKENSQNYSKSHKVLARFILKDYQKVAFTTIQQFAELSGISEPTIIRFVRVLGFKGYPAFLKEIRRIVRIDLKGNERFKIAADFRDNNFNPITKIISKEIENLSYLKEIFNEKDFKETILTIKRAKDILIVGTRSTSYLTLHFWFGLTKLEMKAERIMSISTETYDYINKLDRNALIIVIGFPRYLRELIDILNFSKNKGIKSITITDSPLSPLRGDINLYTPAESISFMAFHCAPLVLINAIVNELSLLDKEHTSKALNRFEILAENRKYFFE